jgi:hypothetical protein
MGKEICGIGIFTLANLFNVSIRKLAYLKIPIPAIFIPTPTARIKL